jgi:Flp pilus assembly protein TadD
MASCELNDRGKSDAQGDSLALALNNEAVRLYSKALYAEDSQKMILFDSAMYFLKSGIKRNRAFIPLYANQAKIQVRLGLLEEAIKTLDTAIAIKPDFAEAFMGQGFIYEKMEHLDSAQSKYDKVVKIYLARLDAEEDNVGLQSNLAFAYFFAEDRSRAIDEIQNFILASPDDEMLKLTEKNIQNIDRKAFIEEY